MKKFFMLFALSVSPFLAAQEGGEESTATTEVVTAEVAASDTASDVSSEGGCNCGGAN